MVKRTTSSLPTQGTAAQCEDARKQNIVFQYNVSISEGQESLVFPWDFKKKKKLGGETKAWALWVPQLLWNGLSTVQAVPQACCGSTAPRSASLHLPAQWASLSAPNLAAFLWQGAVGRRWETIAVGLATLQGKQVSSPWKRRAHFNSHIQLYR